MVALAVLKIKYLSAHSESIHEGLELLSKAFKLNPNNTLCLLQLADHYFFKKDYEKAEKLAKKGMDILEQHTRKSQDTENEKNEFVEELCLLKSNFNFVLGKINHVQVSFYSIRSIGKIRSSLEILLPISEIT